MADRKIILPAKRLLSERAKIVERMLRSIAYESKIKCDFAEGIWHGSKALGAFQGLLPRGDPAEWTFETRVKSIRGNYHEHWRTDDEGEYFWLFKAYLALYRVTDQPVKREVLCLHSDPNDNDSEPMRSWKRSPHLHIDDGAGFPMKKCHFPLELGNLDRALVDAESFGAAYSRAIRVIDSDLLSRYREAGL